MTKTELLRRYAAGERELSRANLYGADLTGANLYGANLYGADLSRANLSRANLCGANLCGADLSRANLYGANLSRANLYGANLTWANLTGANLYGADLSRANLPALTVLWQAFWGELPDALAREAMRWDAVFHHDTSRFNAWAKGGRCPYSAVGYQRAINFQERASCWRPGNPRMSAIAFTAALLNNAGCKHSLGGLL